MTSVAQKLIDRGEAKPPWFVRDNIHYEVITGSIAYGVSEDTSDLDIYGFCIPPKDMVFPHLAGEIMGFGTQKKRFEQWQEHHIRSDEKVYDLSIYSIIKFLHLVMENNPNMVDTLFVPQRCVLHSTQLGQLVRENRRRFLHKGSWPKLKGYAYSQLHKMKGGKREGKRKEIFDKFGYDVKFATHTVRLLLQAEQILTEGDLDLERHREQLKSIRRGEWAEAEIIEWAGSKEKALERAYEQSSLPWGPDEDWVKSLLLQCLEHHYGSLSECVVTDDVLKTALRQIADIVDTVRKNL